MKPVQTSLIAIAACIAAALPGGTISASEPAYAGDEPAGCQGAEQVRAAILYGYGIYEFARTRSEAISDGHQAVNLLHHRKQLMTPQDQAVTSPNIDTLYSSAFLDLSGGPLVVTTPEAPSRYHSIAFMNTFTDNVAYLGLRTTGGKAGTYWIAGPDWNGPTPEAVTLIEVDTNDIWMLGRTVVAGIDDLPAALAVQEGITLSRPDGTSEATPVMATPMPRPDPETFLAVVNEMLGRSPVTTGQAARAQQFAACGILPGDLTAWHSLAPAEQTLWTENFAATLESLQRRTRHTQTEDGTWRSAPPGTGRFGENDELRAKIALTGLAALSAEEATYFVTGRDSRGEPLDGRATYTFTLPPEGVPADAFWSLTLYAEDTDGRFFLVENPISRYSISDRTPDLLINKDGSTTIYLQSEPPLDRASANWLPTPEGPFSLSLRAYLPRGELLEGAWHPPLVEPAPEE